MSYSSKGTMSIELTAEPGAQQATEPTLEQVLHALSDPVRLRIVAALADAGELACGGVDVPVTKSTCTHHFRVLARPA